MRDWAGRGGRRDDRRRPARVGAALARSPSPRPRRAVLAATSGPDGVLVASVVWEADAVTIRVAVRATQLTDELVAPRRGRGSTTSSAARSGYTLATTAPGLVLSAGRRRAAVVAAARRRRQAELAGPDPRRAAGVARRPPRGGPAPRQRRWRPARGAVGRPHAVAARRPARRTPPRTRHRVGRRPAGRRSTATDTRSHDADDVHGPGLGHPAGRPCRAGAPPRPRSTSCPTPTTPTPTAPSRSRPSPPPTARIRHVVYLPGTDDLATTPWSQDGDVRDLGTNLLLVSGQDNAYQQGILDAMQQAGIRPGQPVALVGHSQGGMEAAAILPRRQGIALLRHPRGHRRLADRPARRLPARQPCPLAGEPRRRGAARSTARTTPTRRSR